MRAILLASATAASFGGLRLRRSTSQGESAPRPYRICRITAVAPTTSTLRNASSPARGITPSHAAKVARRSEGFGRRCLHHQHRRADRTNARDLRQAPTAFVGSMPHHQLGLDLFQLFLKLRIFSGVERE